MPSTTGNELLVGRERELVELESALDRAAESQGGIAMIAGEPGIGKTRLTEELESIAITRGFKVNRGTSFDGGSTPPYWPWIQILRSLASDSSQETQTAFNDRADVFAEIVPGIDVSPGSRKSAPETDSAHAKFRLFDSVATFFDEISLGQPIVLILDDLQWADPASLELMRFLVQQGTTSPILFLGSYRDTELSRKHPLSETLAALARVRNFRRIPLRGLGSEDVARMIDSVGDMLVAPEVVQEIHSRTEGNPFFVYEVVRDMHRETSVHGSEFDVASFRIPEGVREAIGIRLNSLSEECNQILQTAAMIGKVFDFELLAALHRELNDESLISLIEEATISGTIREVPGQTEHYDFSHALIQETVKTEMTAGRRVRTHVRIIEAMEELYPDHLDQHAMELAHHCSEAETMVGEEKVVRYATLAGEKASAGYSWHEARAYYEQALDALGNAGTADNRAAILFGLGRAELFTLTYPDIQRGWDHVTKAFDLYVDLGDTQSALYVTSRASGFLRVWVTGTLDVYSRALEMVTSGSAEEADLLEKYAIGLILDQQDPERAEQVLQQALEIARNTGNTHIECRVLNSLCGVKVGKGEFQSAVDLGLKALTLARKTNQPIEEFGCRDKLASATIYLGNTEDALRHLDAAENLQDRFGVRAAIEWLRYLITLLQGQLTSVGDLGDAIDREHADDSVNRLFVGLGAWHIGAQSDLDERIRAANEEARTASTLLQRAANISLLALAAHITDQPLVAIQTGDIAKQITSNLRSSLLPFNTLGFVEGLATVARQDAVVAAEQYRDLESWCGAMIPTTAPMAGDRLLGLLAHTAGMTVQSDAHFEAALMFSAGAGYHLETAWVLHDYANALISRASDNHPSQNSERDFEQAASLLDEGLAVANKIGSQPLVNKLIGLQQKVRSMAVPVPKSDFPDSLTSREVEVLRLLAAGNTNQQIADQLVIALNTVRTHVANILGKTGSANRTEAAVYASQKGLSDS